MGEAEHINQYRIRNGEQDGWVNKKDHLEVSPTHLEHLDRRIHDAQQLQLWGVQNPYLRIPRNAPMEHQALEIWCVFDDEIIDFIAIIRRAVQSKTLETWGADTDGAKAHAASYDQAVEGEAAGQKDGDDIICEDTEIESQVPKVNEGGKGLWGIRELAVRELQRQQRAAAEDGNGKRVEAIHVRAAQGEILDASSDQGLHPATDVGVAGKVTPQGGGGDGPAVDGEDLVGGADTPGVVVAPRPGGIGTLGVERGHVQVEGDECPEVAPLAGEDASPSSVVHRQERQDEHEDAVREKADKIQTVAVAYFSVGGG